ncbi:MAG: glutamate formimidoyltransferase [Planctomycetota bacterium]|jgi:glutamate formiminotransferase/formiminotetrahydrofolate cyclodeaminase|nr:glutamate formimidoyltransferase [Planctomycetota bacterium]MDP6941877.1 glutamate formimidoyltransferase [Planctomycetota bacterium]
MKKLIECVPNFSEGRDPAIIEALAAVVREADGVNLLDVDPGAATNRTVVTFVGEPGKVLDAAVAVAKKSTELIDMSKHTGEHPRFGAMDVCPLVPVSGVSMEETVEYARELGRRLGEEAGLTIYCYEHAATRPERKNLAVVRAGEYEALAERLKDPEWAPDFGPSTFQARTGATAVSARNFLVAYNVNLNTTSSRRANAIAFDVREKGRIKREPCPLTGEIVRDENGKTVWVPGSLTACKGIGWFIEEFGICQVSMNLTDIAETPVHIAFDEVCSKAQSRGVRVTGSELVGLIPLSAMLDAGRHYLRKQSRSTGVSDRELIKIAVTSMGLNELKPFEPEKAIIEYAIQAMDSRKRLCDLSVRGFTEETASESPAPGGGSVSAALGAFGSALGSMVANLSSHKRGWDERWDEFSDWAEKGKACQDELLHLIDEDTDSFTAVMEAWRLPDGSDAEKEVKEQAIQSAVLYAIEVPLRVMEVSHESMVVAKEMAKSGLQASLSDAGVAALCARSAVMGAHLNVRINASDLKDEPKRQELLLRASEISAQAVLAETEILKLVDTNLDS